MVAREFGIAGNLEVLADPALGLDSIVLRVIMARVLAPAVGRPERKLRFSGFFDVCRVDVAEVGTGRRRWCRQPGPDGGSGNNEQAAAHELIPQCCWKSR